MYSWISLIISLIFVAFPLVMLVRVIFSAIEHRRRMREIEIEHRRRMREIDELAKRQDFWGLIRWGEKYRGKR